MKKILLISRAATIFLFGLCLSQICHTGETSATFPPELTGDQLYEQGLTLCNQEKYQEAIPYLEEATKKKANFGEAYYQLGACYLETKQFDKARNNLFLAKTLLQDKSQKSKADILINRIPEEIEREKQEIATRNIDTQKLESIKETDTGIIPENNYADLGREIKRTYFSSGRIESEINYKNDKKDGESKTYHQNGKIATMGYYVDGMKYGTFKQFQNNGIQVSEENWKNDVKDGKQIYYDLNYIVNNKPLIAKIENYKNDVLNGRQQTYTRGIISGEQNFRNGIRDGWQYNFEIVGKPPRIRRGSKQYYKKGEEKERYELLYDDTGHLKETNRLP